VRLDETSGAPLPVTNQQSKVTHDTFRCGVQEWEVCCSDVSSRPSGMVFGFAGRRLESLRNFDRRLSEDNAKNAEHPALRCVIRLSDGLPVVGWWKTTTNHRVQAQPW
jgi:hypothetical protein